jgi:hypothetical protein
MTDQFVTFTGAPRAKAPGYLIKLPALGLSGGELLLPEEQDPHDPGGSPVAWATTGPDLRPLYQRLVAAFPRTGLWPVVARGLGVIDRIGTNVTRGFSDEPGRDAFAVLKRFGGEHITALAPGVDPIPAIDLRLPHPITSLLVVPVARPADVPAALRWLGACNRFMTGDDISAVLRSWEDRYGAILVEIGATTMRMVAAAVPDDPDDFEGLLVEHYVFDYDVVDQIIMSEERHRELVKRGQWEFWWD